MIFLAGRLLPTARQSPIPIPTARSAQDAKNAKKIFLVEWGLSAYCIQPQQG